MSVDVPDFAHTGAVGHAPVAVSVDDWQVHEFRPPFSEVARIVAAQCPVEDYDIAHWRTAIANGLRRIVAPRRLFHDRQCIEREHAQHGRQDNFPTADSIDLKHMNGCSLVFSATRGACRHTSRASLR
ncbi:hypothetical protein [Burkholderia contaminans]|uniref:hypothetical protein n=1 Tax=Burkholderia contaminans TaxID=488447 RepID=UPI00299ECE28|nr:hypothetical protein [Burkholderia contaminans]